MTITDILTAIASVGFPIVACCGMAYFFAKVNDSYRSDLKELSATHKEETTAMTAALNEIKLVIQRLVDKLEEDKK
jgi:hypothetical protein